MEADAVKRSKNRVVLIAVLAVWFSALLLPGAYFLGRRVERAAPPPACVVPRDPQLKGETTATRMFARTLQEAGRELLTWDNDRAPELRANYNPETITDAQRDQLTRITASTMDAVWFMQTMIGFGCGVAQ